MKVRTCRIVQIALVGLLCVCAARADMFYISQDGDNSDGRSWATAFSTFQAAIDSPSVESGDIIRVKKGVYTVTAPIVVHKAITFYGGYMGEGATRNPATMVTAVDGGGNVAHCLRITADATLDGVWVMQGRAFGSGSDNEGGAIVIENCGATIYGGIFQSNSAERRGGAIAARGADGARIENCTFVQNVAGSEAGAIYILDSAMTITDCSFTQNSTEYGTGTRGGAIFIEEASPTVSRCLFTGNLAGHGASICTSSADAYIFDCEFAGCDLDSVFGGGIYNYGSATTIDSCLFYSNQVRSNGGAIYDGAASSSTVVNCIVRNNYAGVNGGGIYIDEGGSTQVTNCTLYANGAGGLGGGVYNYEGQPVLTNCIVWENSAGGWSPGVGNSSDEGGNVLVANYSDIQGTEPYPGTSNIVVEPSFVNAAGDDLRLNPGSPCIDAGDNSAPGIVSQDFDGNPRIIDGDLDGTATVDLGVYEYQGSGIAGHIKWIEIFQIELYPDPGDEAPVYLFLMTVETEDVVEHVEFLTPGGFACTIPNDAYVPSGNTETYHYVSGSTHVWQYWGQFDNPADLANYGDGTYLVTAHFTNGSTQQTAVWYGVPDTYDPVPQPTQKPNVTSPPHGGATASPVTLQWDQNTDSNVNTIFLAVIDSDTSEKRVSENFGVTDTSSDAYNLDEGWYDVELAFGTFYGLSNADGIPFQYGKATSVRSQIEVLYTSVYRFWAPQKGRHFYTISAREKQKLIDQYAHVWTYEGPVFKACATPYYENLVPVYRFWSDSSSAHFYTIKESEKDKLIEQYAHVWTYEGVVMYAYPEGAQPAETRPVYRFWKASDNTHFYTMSESEKAKLMDQYAHIYSYEGIAFYCYE